LSAIKANLSEHLQIKTTCPTGWTNFSCSCYLLSDESGSWDQGRENCRARGADLVVIDSPKEQVQYVCVYAHVILFANSWHTLFCQEGTWKWVDKTPLNLT
uniref:C-type lectin domain-containing protein n=1 Tax=Lates calcarifer TaxID=8187 RepID=A0A4W6FVG2_LATCA